MFCFGDPSSLRSVGMTLQRYPGSTAISLLNKKSPNEGFFVIVGENGNLKDKRAKSKGECQKASTVRAVIGRR